MTNRAIIQIFAEFGPVVAFFTAGQLLPFTQAVAVLVVTTILGLILSWLNFGRLPVLPLWSGVIVIITGTLTIYFQMPDAIIIADTIYFWLFAALVAIGFYRPTHFLERLFDETFAITPAGWRRLSQRWLVVLIIAGFANEYVRMTMTPEFWIDYKFTKVILLTMFSLYQFTLARKYRIEGESNIWGLRISDNNRTT